MALLGPSYIHYRTSDNIVIGVFLESRTPIAGAVEVHEQHPLFNPKITSTRWERQGVATYVDIGPFLGVDPEIDVVGVSSDDTDADFLEEKLIAGSGITLTTNVDSVGYETLTVSFDGSSAGGMSSAPLVGAWHNADDDDCDDEDKDFTWSSYKVSGRELVMAKAGEIVCFSVSMEQSRTNGYIDFGITINGIAQNSTGQMIRIDGTNPKYHYVELSVPISYNAGDRLFSFTDAKNFYPTSNDGLFGVWIRDTE
jgi:hypothetical protein